MTQLNLSGNQSSNPQKNSNTEPEGGSITNQTVGALGALAMFAAVIVIGSCSRSSAPVAIQPPVQPTPAVSAPAVMTPAPAPVPAPTQAKARTKKRRPASVSYANPQYGVSFSFPRQYSLKSGDAAQLNWGDLGPFQMDFVHPGGVTLAGVQLPANSYPGTDFKSGFVTVSVNPGMTSEACTQFAFPEAKAGADTSSQETGDPASKESKTADKPALSEVEGSVRPTDATTKVKIGDVEFTAIENSTAATTKQTDAKYYHAFNNGACYEFALGIGTENDGNVEGITPVDRKAVFGKLEKILATVKLQAATVPETATAAPSAKEAAPDASANTKNKAPDTQEQSAVNP